MEISAMTKQDILKVQQIAMKSWHATYENIIPLEIQNKFLTHAYSEEMLLNRLTNSPFYVAKIEDEIVGFANFSNKKENGEVELGAIYLHPDFQNKGTGTALLEHGCKQLHPTQVFINVESDNEIGKQFYISKGFQVVGKYDEDFAGHTLKNLRMVLDCK